MGKLKEFFLGPPPVETRDMGWWSLGLDSPWPQEGTPVTTTTVLGLSGVWASVSLLSNGISTLPLDVYVRATDGQGNGVRLPAPVRPSWLDYPDSNPWSAPSDVLSQVMASLLLRGNAYVLTPRAQGLVTGLLPLDPDQVQVQEDGSFTVAGERLGPYEVAHLRGLVLPGSRVGASVLTYARASLQHGLAIQEFGANFFRNGAWPGVMVSAPGPLSADAQTALKESWNVAHKGTSNAHRVAVLTEGAKLEKMTLTPEDSQFLESGKWKVSDVARFFSVPPHLIGDTEPSTAWGTGLQEMTAAFLRFSLAPWISRIEQAYTRLWHSEGGDRDGFIKLNTNALLRGTTKERYDAYAVGLANGFLTVEECRQHEDLPPLPQPAKEGANA